MKRRLIRWSTCFIFIALLVLSNMTCAKRVAFTKPDIDTESNKQPRYRYVQIARLLRGLYMEGQTHYCLPPHKYNYYSKLKSRRPRDFFFYEDQNNASFYQYLKSTKAKPNKRLINKPAGKLSLAIEPKDAVVLVDGWKLQYHQGYCSLDLTVGKHKIVVKAKGFRRQSKTIIIEAKKTKDFDISLFNKLSNR